MFVFEMKFEAVGVGSAVPVMFADFRPADVVERILFCLQGVDGGLVAVGDGAGVEVEGGSLVHAENCRADEAETDSDGAQRNGEEEQHDEGEFAPAGFDEQFVGSQPGEQPE